MAAGKLNNLIGVSVKHHHHHDIISAEELPPLFEFISENYMNTQGLPLHVASYIADQRPTIMHGVSLSVGSERLDRRDYFERLRALANRIDPIVISDHLCFTGWHQNNTHDLLPLPLTAASFQRVRDNLNRVQDVLGRQFTMENISRYVDFHASYIPEQEFLAELAGDTGCGLLLDINNVYVNSRNFDFDPYEFLDTFPAKHVVQYHMAGHTDRGTYLYDTHVGPVPQPVMDLFKYALQTIGAKPTILEWDADVPSFKELLAERHRIAAVAEESCPSSTTDSNPPPTPVRDKLEVTHA